VGCVVLDALGKWVGFLVLHALGKWVGVSCFRCALIAVYRVIMI